MRFTTFPSFRQRLGSLCLLLIAASAGLLGAQTQAIGETAASEVAASESADLPALLPDEGLFRYETWTQLGQRFLENAIDYLPKLLAAALVLLLFYILSRVLSRVVRTVLQRTSSDPALVNILSRMTHYVVLILGLLMAISQAGLAVGPLLASVSVLGLAVGLAAQDSLSNLVAGFTILWDRPFQIGDRVTIADTYGEVSGVSIRTTTVRTMEHRELIIPNKEVIDGVIINHSRTPNLRLSIPVGIGYAEDTQAARERLLEIAASSDHVDQDRESTVVVTELADSSVNLQLRVWLRDPKSERGAFFELVEGAKRALDEAGIEIPFPQRVLHLETAPAPLRVVSEESRVEAAG